MDWCIYVTSQLSGILNGKCSYRWSIKKTIIRTVSKCQYFKFGCIFICFPNQIASVCLPGPVRQFLRLFKKISLWNILLLEHFFENSYIVTYCPEVLLYDGGFCNRCITKRILLFQDYASWKTNFILNMLNTIYIY